MGNAGCDLDELKKVIEYIKARDHTYWLGLGDYIDAIVVNDAKRFDPRSIDQSYKIADLSNLIRDQIKYIIDLLKPIAGRGLAVFCGNHEEHIRLHYYYDVLLELARELSLPAMGYDGFVRLHFHRTKSEGRNSFDIYATHGFGGSRRSGGKVNKLEDLCYHFDADIIMVGHEHKKIIAPPVLRLGLNNACQLIQKKQLAVMTGSFLRGYVEGHTSYVERNGYPPTDLGVVKISIAPYHNEINASL